MPRIAVLQMTSGVDPEANFATIVQAMRDAKAEGAKALFTPEMSLLLDRNRKRASNVLSSADYRKYPQKLADLARENEIDLAIGSMPISTDSEKWSNRSMYFPADGRVATIYDKIHMFDVELSTGESWRESAAYQAGERIGLVDETPVGRLGLTICYDLRFPALFQRLGEEKCDTIAIPAAFTVPTGKAHWHVLQRARAIEASAFVVAAAQVGKHEDGRETYGHSLVVDPWGEVLLDMGGEEAGLGVIELDLSRIGEVRAQLPSLANRRNIPK